MTIVVLAVSLGAWAARATLAEPADLLSESGPAHYKVEIGTVGDVQNVFVEASWDIDPVAVNHLAGIVTSVDRGAGLVSSGDVVYRVDLQPVVVAAGEVPAFRTMTEGLSGPDVAQLQQLLADAGFYGGPRNGSFTASVASSVRRWKSALGAPASGEVAFGQVVFLPGIGTADQGPPISIVVGDAIEQGAVLRGGEVAFNQVSEAPSFAVKLLAEQQRLGVVGSDVTIESVSAIEVGTTAWQARVARVIGDGDGSRLELEAVGSEPICADRCSELEVGDVTLLRGRLTLVAETSGPVVPVGAILTAADGSTSVVTEDGSNQPVVVKAVARGLAVVDGLEAGRMVRVQGPPPGRP